MRRRFEPLAKLAVQVLRELGTPATLETIQAELPVGREYSSQSLSNQIGDCAATTNNLKSREIHGIDRPILFERCGRDGAKKLWRLTRLGSSIPLDDSWIESHADTIDAHGDIDTQIQRLAWVRTAQASFRDDLFTRWDRACCVTKTTEPSVLVAAHIKPWAVCDDNERVDPENGLLLTPLYDRLFDRFLITFTLENGRATINVSPTLDLKQLAKLGVDPNASFEVNVSHKSMAAYLRQHNELFQARCKQTSQAA